MGDITEMIMEGILCDVCGGLAITENEQEPGHPQTCEDCEED
ncbi:hypothetical protein [Alkalicoccus chagannorensis]|nr:hypothetical protein [Alkalicoccus chagannorensis]